MPHALEPMTDAELAALDRAPRAEEDRSFGALRCERGQLPLEAMDIDARVVGLVSTVELVQTFANGFAEPIEAIYVLPLPDRAAVTSFRFEVAGRVIDGIIKEREQAQRDYAEAIVAGHRAALAEEERPGVFTMKVGNLMPGERAKIRLRLTGPVPLEDGDPTFRFPLVVAPRYMPGVPLPGDSVGSGTAVDTDAVPDASRISPPVLLPGYPNPVRLSLRLEIDPAGMPIDRLRSSLHAVAETASGGVHHIALQPGSRLDRDFIVRFALGDGALRTALVTTPDADGADGTFMLTLVPPRDAGRGSRPRDVVFVLDRSGSMGGWKMVAARRAVARMVDTLTDRDSFAVMAFDDRIDWPTGQEQKLTPASDRNRFRAVEFLAAVDARGGTEMARPLTQGVDMLVGGYQDRDRVLVLVTDGQVGNEDQILAGLGKRLKNVRVFTLGIDRAVNAAFLKRLAAVGGGACSLIESEDRLDDVMDAVHRRIGTPVVTELSLVARGGELAPAPLPARMPELCAGAPVTIFGRYRGRLDAVGVRGLGVAGTPWDEVVKTDGGAAARAHGATALQAMWARGHIRDLEDRYIVGREDRGGLERRIVQTSLRFSVLSRFTAFVAVDRSEKINPGGDPRAVIQPVELPDGWAAGGAHMNAPVPRSPAGMPKTMMGGMGAGSAAYGAPPSMPSPAPAKTMMIGAPADARPAPMSPAPMSPAFSAPPPPMEKARAKAKKAEGGRARSVVPSSKDMAREAAPEEAEMVAQEESVDLTPYRDRLRALRTRLDDASTGGDEDRLLATIAALRVLREDLESIDAPAAMIRALSELEAELRRIDTGDAAAVRAGLARAGAVLDEVLAARPGTGGKPGGERKPFWKIW
jgi:Ca-activated chloride channel family protein